MLARLAIKWERLKAAYINSGRYAALQRFLAADRTLTEQARRILTWHNVGGMSFREIARVYHMTPDAVSEIHRGATLVMQAWQKRTRH